MSAHLDVLDSVVAALRSAMPGVTSIERARSEEQFDRLLSGKPPIVVVAYKGRKLRDPKPLRLNSQDADMSLKVVISNHEPEVYDTCELVEETLRGLEVVPSGLMRIESEDIEDGTATGLVISQTWTVWVKGRRVN